MQLNGENKMKTIRRDIKFRSSSAVELLNANLVTFDLIEFITWKQALDESLFQEVY